MARLVVKDNITSGGALAAGQTLRLGGFVMTARSAAAPTMTSRVIENSLHVGSEFAEQLDPMELSSLNELLDRIAALGVAMDYDRIGLKPDQREINSPPVTHQRWWRNNHYKKYTPVMIRVCHSRSRFLSCMYIHGKFMRESR